MKQIVWAVDNQVEDRALQERCLPAIQMLAPEARIQPVCVATPAQLLKYNSGIADILEDLEGHIRTELTEWVGKLGAEKVEAPVLLIEDKFSIKKSVQTLLEHADQVKADAIALTTHARHGVKRVALGSFAETLVCLSKRPVLVVNPKAQVQKKIRRILVPTDLTEKSFKALDVALTLAKRDGAEIRVFHQIEYLNDLSVSTFNYSSVYSQYLKEDVEHREQEGKQWVEKARKAGVKAEFILSERGGYPVEGILREGKTCDLTIMVSQTGPISSALLGSVTRAVLREVEEPVLVVHP